MNVPVALSIAGSDSGGGAGVQADIKTFQRFGVFGTTAITLVTAQNTLGIRHVHLLPPWLVAEQIKSVTDDLTPVAVKTGALGSALHIEAIADQLAPHGLPLVIDPVIFASDGRELLDDRGVQMLVERLLPLAVLVTPNLQEAARLAGRTVEDERSMCDAARAIRSRGCRAVLVKGGHLDGEATDVYFDGEELTIMRASRVRTRNGHGTGCTHAAAITALLAHRVAVCEAVVSAKRYVTSALEQAPGLGRGRGPLNHWCRDESEHPSLLDSPSEAPSALLDNRGIRDT